MSRLYERFLRFINIYISNPALAYGWIAKIGLLIVGWNFLKKKKQEKSKK